ncbi:MAG: cytochrome c biogenesis protein CcdA [Kiritimatiellales bacterium]
MTELFTQLTHAIGASSGVALAAAFVWGCLSILLSPCHLASIPLIIGLVDRQHEVTVRRVFTISLMFAVGILLSIAIIGLITALAGRILGDIGRYGNYIGAAIFFAVGLQLLGVLSSPWKKPDPTGMQSGSPWVSFCTGLIFGIALGPCAFAFMAPVLAVTFKLSVTAPLYALSILLLFAIGHCAVIVLAGISTGFLRKYRNWNEVSRGAIRLRKICGILILLAGLYLVYTA